MNPSLGFRLSPVPLFHVACLFGAAGSLHGAPTGGEVTAGAAEITAAAGNTTIHQGSDRAIIHWNDFSIGAGESVNFIMPNAGSAVLNRVTGSGISSLDGQLSSNGQVYLINPHGIVIGSSGVVATQGFVAGTGAVLDGEFLEGRRMTVSGATGNIVNAGKIDGGQGNVVLMARQIDQKGAITAGGSVALGAGTEVTLTQAGDGGMSVRVTGEGKIDQSGTIEAARAELRAAGGNPYSLAINHDGVTRATGAVKSGGKVILTGGSGGVRIGGKIQAAGGKVDVTGKRVELAAMAEVDVSGAEGGGTIRVGGGFGGKEADLAHADEVEVKEGARLTADALESGDGGRIAIWSDHATHFTGGLSVQGAGTGGAGGFAEISSAGWLDFTGSAMLGGSGGTNGTLLLDPTDLTIGAAQASSIVSSLNSGNVVVATAGSGAGAGNLTINSTISYTSANALFFLAHGNVRVNATVRNAGTGDITAIAGWDGATGAAGNVGGAGFLANAATYGNHSGSIFIGSATQTTATSFGSRHGDVFIGGSSLTVAGGNAQNAYSQIGWHAVDLGAAHTASGDMAFALKGALTLQAGTATRTLAQIGHGGSVSSDIESTDDGSFSGNITATVAGATTLTGSNATTSYAQIGHGGFASRGSKGGTIFLETGSLSAISGNGNASYTQIGHGGMPSNSPAYSGDITVHSAGNITLTSATQFASSRIGHGSVTTTGATGDIEVTALDLLMNMKANGQSESQIGHGGTLSGGTFGGDIDVTVRDLTMDATGLSTVTLIGHWGGSSTISGNVTVQAREVSMFASNNNSGPMQIGHMTNSGSLNGTTTVLARDISMRAGNSGAVPRIGMGAEFGNIVNAAGNIVINGRNLTMVGGNSFSSFTRIGHGGSLNGTVQGDINITISGETSMAPGSGAVPLIGHSTTSQGGRLRSNVTLTTGTLDDSATATATSVTLRNGVRSVFQSASQYGDTTLVATGLNGNDGLLVLDQAYTGFSPYTVTFASTRDLTVDVPVTFQATWAGDIRFLFGQVAGGTLRLNAAASTPGTGTASITGGLFDDTVILGNSGTIEGVIDGGGGNNTLTGDANANAFVITGTNSGTLTGKTSGWQNFSNLSGEGGNDTFAFSNTGSLAGSIGGGVGTNTLTGDADGNEFIITGANSGSLAGKTNAWSGIQTLTGAAGSDRFSFVTGGSISSVNGAGGSDFLQLPDSRGQITINGVNSGTYTPVIASGWSNIENLVGGMSADVFIFTNAGRLDGVITGGGGGDTLRGDDDGNQFTITSGDGGTLATKLSAWSGISSLEGGAGNDTFTFTDAGSLAGTIAGGSGTNSLTASYDRADFIISGTNSGVLTGRTSGWSGIQSLIGGASSDRFTFSEAGSVTTINGAGSNDSLRLPDSGGLVTITGINSGSYLPHITSGWTDIESLVGGTGADVFAFTNAGRLSGSISGNGGGDILRGDDDGNQFGLTSGGGGTLSGKLTGWFGIDFLEGGSGNDTLAGTLSHDEFVISGSNAGSANGLLPSWSGIENLAGSNGDDTFRFSGSGNLTGSITGGQGRNEVIAPDSGGVFVLNDLNTGRLVDRVGFEWTGIQDLTGGSGDDLFQFFIIASITGQVDGGGGVNTLQGDNRGGTFTITGTNSGTLSGKLESWSNISNLLGGDGVDRFHFDGGSLADGSIVGGAGDLNFLQVFGSTGVRFVLDGGREGSISDLLGSWSEIGDLVGSDGDDRFEIAAGGPFAGSLDGGGGIDTMAATVPTHFYIFGDRGSVADWQGVWSSIEVHEGSSGDDLFEVSGPLGLISGMGGNDTLKSYSGGVEFLIDEIGSGSLGAMLWEGIENLTGANGRDFFRFIGAGRVDGLLDGGGGNNQLNFSQSNTAVEVDLAAGTVSRTGGISGIAEIIGSAFGDVFRGGPFAALLDGGAGDDVFEIHSGDQSNGSITVIGGSGNNEFTFTFADSLVDSTVRLTDGAISREWDGGDEQHSFSDISLVRVIAGGGSDRVETAGFAFAQELDGGRGDNTLVLDGAGYGVIDPASPVAIGDNGLITHINFGTVDVTSAATPDEVRAIIAASSSSFDLSERADLLRFLWFLESSVQARQRGGFHYLDRDGKPLEVMADSLSDR